MEKGDKIALIADNEMTITTLFEILAGNIQPDQGEFNWGVTVTHAYLPNDNASYFESGQYNLIDWLRQYSNEKDESFIRGFLGKMLFSGDQALKKTNVLSGGEKVRCMLSKMMLAGPNVLMMDGPTNHLDLESITAVNEGLIKFKGSALFASHDHEFVQTIANRIIEIDKNGRLVEDKRCTFDEFLAKKLSA
jgi:ATPase subunit of ABC transporter with duplicated ATPase domains